MKYNCFTFSRRDEEKKRQTSIVDQPTGPLLVRRMTLRVFTGTSFLDYWGYYALKRGYTERSRRIFFPSHHLSLSELFSSSYFGNGNYIYIYTIQCRSADIRRRHASTSAAFPVECMLWSRAVLERSWAILRGESTQSTKLVKAFVSSLSFSPAIRHTHRKTTIEPGNSS